MPISAIVFDFDGVLANSEPLHLRAYQAVLQDLGIIVERDEYYAQYLGFDDIGAFKAIAAARNQAWTDDEVLALVERKTLVFDEMLTLAEVLYPNAVACVGVLVTVRERLHAMEERRLRPPAGHTDPADAVSGTYSNASRGPGRR